MLLHSFLILRLVLVRARVQITVDLLLVALSVMKFEIIVPVRLFVLDCPEPARQVKRQLACRVLILEDPLEEVDPFDAPNDSFLRDAAH